MELSEEPRSGGLGRVSLGRIGRRLVTSRSVRLRGGVRRLVLFAARSLLGLDPLLGLGLLRLLRLLTVRTLPSLIPAICCDNSVIVFGVLEEIFGADPVSRRERVLRQGLVFLDDLERGSPDLSFGAIALEG